MKRAGAEILFKVNRAILPGIFLTAACLLWGVRDVSAGTEVKVGTESAGGVYFYNTESELDIYLTRNLYFKYGYTSDGIKKGGVTAVLDGATYIDGPYSEISRVIAPGVYNFRLTYSSPGTQSSDPIYWWAWVGYTNYQHTVYIYDQRISYVKITYGQTINGTITVSDVGQSIKLEAVSGYNQRYYAGMQFPQKLVARASKSDGQPVSGKQVGFSLKSGPQFGQAAFTNPSAITGADGTVETFFTLSGPTYMTYTIRAYCADCPLQQEALFTETLMEKTYVLQKLPDGDNQTWLVGQTLPKQLSVKVMDSQNNPVDGADIRFSVSAPQQGDWSFPGNVKEITVKTDKGLAKTDFKLGTAAGEYTINADCAICAAGNNNVMFTEKAVTDKNIAMELRKISGDSTGWVNTEALNPLRVQAFNRITGKGEPGFTVNFSTISTPPGEASPSLSNTTTITNALGIAQTKFTFGKIEGDSEVKARCEFCLANKEVVFVLNAQKLPKDISGKPENPFDLDVSILGPSKLFLVHDRFGKYKEIILIAYPNKNGGGTYNWEILKNTDKVEVVGNYNSSQFTLKPKAESVYENDVEVKVSYTLSDKTVSRIHYLTVEVPKDLKMTKLENWLCSSIPKVPGMPEEDCGVLSHFQYIVLNQFGKPMQIPRSYDIEVVEYVDAQAATPEEGRHNDFGGEAYRKPKSTAVDNGKFYDEIGWCAPREYPSDFHQSAERCAFVGKKFIFREKMERFANDANVYFLDRDDTKCYDRP